MGFLFFFYRIKLLVGKSILSHYKPFPYWHYPKQTKMEASFFRGYILQLGIAIEFQDY